MRTHRGADYPRRISGRRQPAGARTGRRRPQPLYRGDTYYYSRPDERVSLPIYRVVVIMGISLAPRRAVYPVAVEPPDRTHRHDHTPVLVCFSPLHPRATPGLGMKVRGGTRPGLSCDRSSLYNSVTLHPWHRVPRAAISVAPAAGLDPPDLRAQRSAGIYRALEAESPSRLLEIPQWMFGASVVCLIGACLAHRVAVRG